MFKLEIGLEERLGLAAPPPLYIEGWCAPSPLHISLQALVALLPSSLPPDCLQAKPCCRNSPPNTPRRRVVDPIHLSTILAGPRKEETSRCCTCASHGGTATCGARSDRIARRRSEYDYITHVPTNVPLCESSRV